MPDAKTIWLYREALAKDETAKALFEAFGAHLKEQGYLAMTPGEWRSKAPCEISSAAIAQSLA